jgi:diketogulonate reductase-like aldo/keto reductase
VRSWLAACPLAASLTLALPDTAQSYRNEVEAGKALRAFPRNKVFLTTKYSGLDGLDIPTSIHNSLKNLGTSYVDLYLIHSPRLARPNIKTVWAQMEAVKAAGCARHPSFVALLRS